jgi:hypothetical protein
MSTQSKHSRDELGRRGGELFERVVRPALRPEDDGKYVAIDIKTGEFEIDASDYAAVMRLRGRLTDPEVWLERAGFPAAYKARHGR